MHIPVHYNCKVLTDFVEILRGKLVQDFSSAADGAVIIELEDERSYDVLYKADRRTGEALLDIVVFGQLMEDLSLISSHCTVLLDGGSFSMKVPTLSGRRDDDPHPDAIYFSIYQASVALAQSDDENRPQEEWEQEIRNALQKHLDFTDPTPVAA